MNRILRCDWLPDRARWSYLALSGLHTVSPKTKCFFFPNNKPFIEKKIHFIKEKMAGYWPGSLFVCLWTSTPSRCINRHKKNLAKM